MTVVLAFLAVAVGYGLVMVVLLRLAARARRRGIGGSLMGAVDQVFHPIAYDSHLEQQVEQERAVPVTSPADRDDPTRADRASTSRVDS